MKLKIFRKRVTDYNSMLRKMDLPHLLVSEEFSHVVTFEARINGNIYSCSNPIPIHPKDLRKAIDIGKAEVYDLSKFNSTYEREYYNDPIE